MFDEQPFAAALVLREKNGIAHAGAFRAKGLSRRVPPVLQRSNY